MALLGLFVNSVPKQRKATAHRAADGRRHSDQDEAPEDLEWFDDIDRLDEMHPENEVDDWLRPAEQHQSRPKQMPAAHECRQRQCGSIWIQRAHACPFSIFP